MATPKLNYSKLTFPDKLYGENWNIWKRVMTNIFTLLDLKEVVENGYVIELDTDNVTHSSKTKQLHMKDASAQNLIMTNIVPSLSVITINCENSNLMWRALIARFEGNNQMKRTKLMGLEQQFECFRMIESESVEDMYSRLTHIRNGFTALKEPLTNSRVSGKLISAMPSSWEHLRVALETMMATQEMAPDDIINYFRNFEERLKQSYRDDMATSSRPIALPAQEKRFDKNRKLKNSTHHALMTYIRPSVESVVEEAIRKMLEQRQNATPQIAFGDVDHKVESCASSSGNYDSDSEEESIACSSHDKDHEVSSKLNLNSLFETDDVETSVKTVTVPNQKCIVNHESQNDLAQELDRLRVLLSVAEQSMSEKDKLIESLKQDLSISETSVKSYKAQVILLEKLKITDSKIETEKLKIEISHLNVEILNLKVENKSLKSTCAPIASSKFDLDKILLGQKPNDKSGLGFKKKVNRKPKNNYKKNGPKNAFIYQDHSRNQSNRNSNFYNRNNQFNQYFPRQTHNNNHYENSERVYKRGPDGYFYEIENTPFMPKPSCAKSINPKFTKTNYSNHYHSHFVKASVNSPRSTCALCNYCCKVGHISLECPLRKPTRSPNVMWLRKDRDTPKST